MTTISSIEPPANSHGASASTNIAATFDRDVNAGTATPQNFVVHSLTRPVAQSVSTTGATVIANPTLDFLPGELVQVTATSRIQSTTAEPVVPRVWQFRTAANGGSGVFTDSGTSLAGVSYGAALGDLDGDGDLDAFVPGLGEANRVLLNNGSGGFTDSGQSLGNHNSRDVALGDLDGDGDLDAFVANYSQGNRVWLNDGAGSFNDSGQSLGNRPSRDVALGDLDGDGDLDAYVANQGGNRIWLNVGGRFGGNGQDLAPSESWAVSLGDVDSDGDLDAYVANQGGNRVWLNTVGFYGIEFVESRQSLGEHFSRDVALGDVDGDGDLDAFVANTGQSRIWLNDGGLFSDSGQGLGQSNTRAVALGDVDGDGNLDAFAGNRDEGNRVWLNDGERFTDSGQSLGNRDSTGLALGDIDGDGDLDAFVANRGNQADRVWLNQNPGNKITLTVDDPAIAEASGVATITATSSTPVGSPVTVSLDIRGTATATSDYLASATAIVIAAEATTGSITITGIDDSLDELDETVIVDISGVVDGAEEGTQQVTITILDDDEPVMPDVTLTVDTASIAEDRGIADFTASLSEVTTVPVTVDLAVGASSTATQTADYTISNLLISIEPGTISSRVTVTAVQDETDEPDETVTMEIVNVTGGNETGEQSATVTILDDDLQPTFQVTSLTPTSTGFVARLNAEADTITLNLGDTAAGANGPADVVLTGAASGSIAGSLVVGDSGRSLTFIATGEWLPADTYTVTLRSAKNGVKDTAGNLLDGDGNGVAGGGFTNTFTVGTSTIDLSVSDFVRGPGQELNLPANSTNGIPITISDGTSVRSASFAIEYHPDLLNITGVLPGANMPAGSTATVDTSTPGRAVVTFTSPTDLPAGPNQLVNLQADVPTPDAAAIYGDQHVLDINSITLTNAAGTELPAIDNDGLHVAAFFGDVSGNGGINASDASQVARVAASLDSGFAESLLTDPMIVGDISGNGLINATDASMVARFAVQLPIDKIPPIPGGVAIAAGVRANTRKRPPQLLAPPVRAPVTIHDWREAAQPSAALGFELSVVVPHPAIDAVMARLENAGAAGDEDQLLPALEDAVEQLLSASQTPPTD